jgi:two-component system CheB/CheR fusion protein
MELAKGKPSHLQSGVLGRILIVDDNLDAAGSLAALLGRDGHETRTTPDGKGALDAIEEGFDPEFVLLDIGLPDMNGYEVAKRIRANGRRSSTWIVALTASGQAEDRVRSHEAGFDAHLVKPVDYEALTKILSSESAGS